MVHKVRKAAHVMHSFAGRHLDLQVKATKSKELLGDGENPFQVCQAFWFASKGRNNFVDHFKSGSAWIVISQTWKEPEQTHDMCMDPILQLSPLDLNP